MSKSFIEESSSDSRDVYKPRRLRKDPKHIGTLQTTPEGSEDRIKYIKVRRGYRGKGIAQKMVQDQEKQTGRRIVHSKDLTRKGKKFAAGHPTPPDLVRKNAFGVEHFSKGLTATEIDREIASSRQKAGPLKRLSNKLSDRQLDKYNEKRAAKGLKPHTGGQKAVANAMPKGANKRYRDHYMGVEHVSKKLTPLKPPSPNSIKRAKDASISAKWAQQQAIKRSLSSTYEKNAKKVFGKSVSSLERKPNFDRQYKRDANGRFSVIDRKPTKSSPWSAKVSQNPFGYTKVSVRTKDYYHRGILNVAPQKKDPTGRKYNEISYIKTHDSVRGSGLGMSMIDHLNDVAKLKVVHSMSLSDKGREFADKDTKNKRLISLAPVNGSQTKRYVVTAEEYAAFGKLAEEQRKAFAKVRSDAINEVNRKTDAAESDAQKELTTYLHSKDRNIKSAPTDFGVKQPIKIEASSRSNKARLAELSKGLDDFDTFLSYRAVHYGSDASTPITNEQASKHPYVKGWRERYPELLKKKDDGAIADHMQRLASSNVTKSAFGVFSKYDDRDDGLYKKNPQVLTDQLFQRNNLGIPRKEKVSMKPKKKKLVQASQLIGNLSAG